MGERRTDALAGRTRFLVMFGSETGERLARVAIESLRTFGGPLRDCPVWAFVLDPDRVPHALPGLEEVRCLPLAVKGENGRYPLAQKVYGCAQAEAMAGPEVRSLVWLSLDCLVINPPVLFDLDAAGDLPAADAAFRPVHHQNVGSPAEEAPDDFWQGIYRGLGVDEMPYTVESFADGRTLRPYFNTHCFALDPATGMGRAWWEGFKTMVRDEAFQAGPCRDESHRIFLHQAVLSALVAKLLPWERVRLLPPEYNYPLNLLHEIPPERRATTLNSLVNAVYEDAFPWDEIEIEEPLRSWLRERMSLGEEG
jgi:hypothetical protein